MGFPIQSVDPIPFPQFQKKLVWGQNQGIKICFCLKTSYWTRNKEGKARTLYYTSELLVQRVGMLKALEAVTLFPGWEKGELEKQCTKTHYTMRHTQMYKGNKDT